MVQMGAAEETSIPLSYLTKEGQRSFEKYVPELDDSDNSRVCLCLEFSSFIGLAQAFPLRILPSF